MRWLLKGAGRPLKLERLMYGVTLLNVRSLGSAYSNPCRTFDRAVEIHRKAVVLQEIKEPSPLATGSNASQPEISLLRVSD
jgi:hypothetical protein